MTSRKQYYLAAIMLLFDNLKEKLWYGWDVVEVNIWIWFQSSHSHLRYDTFDFKTYKLILKQYEIVEYMIVIG